MILEIIAIVTVVAILIAASIIDNKTMRIPNQLTLPMIPIGLIMSFILSLESGIYASATVVALFFLGMTGFLGMGDLKLAMVIASFQGPVATVFSVVVAAMVFIFVHVKHNPAQKVNMKLLLNKEKAEKEGTYLPFAMYMLIGYIAYIVTNVIPPEGFNI